MLETAVKMVVGVKAEVEILWKCVICRGACLKSADGVRLRIIFYQTSFNICFSSLVHRLSLLVLPPPSLTSAATMKAPQPFVPTRRELVLLAGLLCALFFITQSQFLVTTEAYTSSLERKQQRVVETTSLGTYPEQKLSWKDFIPETKIVAHVPGELPDICSAELQNTITQALDVGEGPIRVKEC